MVLSDKEFSYPDYQGQTVTIQDCWRARNRTEEQDAVRALLGKMNFEVHELQENSFRIQRKNRLH